MPALITHDTFGRDVYAERFDDIGNGRDECDAFLLGNQGPDPLFYAVASPRLRVARRLGSLMHAQRPSELLAALRRSVSFLAPADQAIGRAYVMGFTCHYVLDSTAHPFIFGQQYLLCDAGEPGLTRDNGGDVHAVIESELDELVLTVRRHTSIAEFDPSREILKASDHVLDVISSMYAFTAMNVYGLAIPADSFKASVKLFRRAQRLFYSPSGVKRDVLGRVESLVRPYSFYRAMSHRREPLTDSAFANSQRDPWENPYTGEVRTASFFDLFEEALDRAETALDAVDAPGFDEEAARAITRDLDFSGEPVVATILAVEAAAPAGADERP
ncbi:MAG: peptidase [Eggerthellaceae bacterium]|nr:peptidase [Eggerthellaceae bacterium]